jgi:hypothetical protein
MTTVIAAANSRHFELLPLDPRPAFRFDTALPILIRLNTTVKSSR